MKRQSAQKMQIFLPDAVALPCATNSGEVDFAEPCAPVLWADLHPNPLTGLVVTSSGSQVGSSTSYARPTPTPSASAAAPERESGPATHSATTPSATAAAASTKRDKRDPEQWPFYCDACQKGFASEETYETHQSSHMYCTVEGCHFTCRKDKAHRMDEHMELLHNRPDAPNFADMTKYREQRRSRFPTQETVQTKVSELYYKAARGAVLPDERRRWMRQHGIQIGKRPRSGEAYIAAGILEEGVAAVEEAAEKVQVGLAVAAAPKASPPVTPCSLPTTTTDPTAAPDAPPLAALTPQQAEHTANATTPRGVPPVKRPPIVPMGPNGTLTPQQRVQLVRQRYADSAEVARFYVCNRCGKKGDHWVSECPTKGDATFDRHVRWGEAKRERPPSTPQHEQGDTPAQLDAAVNSADTSGIAENEQDRVAEETPASESINGRDEGKDEDTASPPAQSARAEAGSDAQAGEKERTRLIAPVAAARLAAKTASASHSRRRVGPGVPSASPRSQQHGRQREPGLYERLTEEDRLNEMGLILQAFRFFVSRDFFAPKS